MIFYQQVNTKQSTFIIMKSYKMNQESTFYDSPEDYETSKQRKKHELSCIKSRKKRKSKKKQ